MANEPEFDVPSFSAHATRGLIRNRRTRRAAMFALILVAAAMVLADLFFLRISHRENLGAFVIYWFVCGWITLTALLLALYDVVRVRRETRTEQESLRQKLKRE